MSLTNQFHTPRSARRSGAWFALDVLALCAALLSTQALASAPKRDTPLELGKRESLRVVLIGDTGRDNEDMRALRRAIQAESKDLVIALGDLIYPEAPACHEGKLSSGARRLLDEGVGKTLLGLGAPVLLVLGNHDVMHRRRDLPREACLLHYAALQPELVMPALSWWLDAGVVSIVGLNTNDLDDNQAIQARRALKQAQGWTLVVGHHVLKTYHDKEDEDVLRPWFKRHKLQPDFYANGHAHLLQAGTYEGIIALTSGSAALARSRPACPPECGAGQRFGSSAPGYALVEFKAERATVSFYDNQAKLLHTETHQRSPRKGRAKE